jgi:hypothetical protein
VVNVIFPSSTPASRIADLDMHLFADMLGDHDLKPCFFSDDIHGVPVHQLNH